MGVFKILLFLCFIGVYTNLCSATAGEELLRMNEDLYASPSHKRTSKRVHLEIKAFHNLEFIKTVRNKEKKLHESSITELKNDLNIEKQIIIPGNSSNISYKNFATIIHNGELSGKINLQIPKLGTHKKFELEFSESAPPRAEKVEEITFHYPPDNITLAPHGEAKRIRQLFIRERTHIHTVSMEVDLSKFFLHCWFASCSRIEFSETYPNHDKENDEISLENFLAAYIKDVLKTSKYPVYIKDRKTNETVIEITEPLPGGKVYVNYQMDVVEHSFSSKTIYR